MIKTFGLRVLCSETGTNGYAGVISGSTSEIAFVTPGAILEFRMTLVSQLVATGAEQRWQLWGTLLHCVLAIR